LEGGEGRFRFLGESVEEGLEIIGHSAEHAGVLHVAFEDFADEGSIVFGVDGDGLESGGPGGFVFVEIGCVVDKRECAGLLDEAKLGDEAHGTTNGGGEGVDVTKRNSRKGS